MYSIFGKLQIKSRRILHLDCKSMFLLDWIYPQHSKLFLHEDTDSQTAIFTTSSQYHEIKPMTLMPLTFVSCHNLLVTGTSWATISLTSSLKPLSLQKCPVPITLKILSMEELEGSVQLKMLNWRFNLSGMSFLPPPGWIMAAMNCLVEKYMSVIILKPLSSERTKTVSLWLDNRVCKM